MTDLTKRKKKRKKLLKSKKAGAIAGLIVCLILISLIVGMFFLMSSMTGQLQIDTRLTGEIDKAAYIARTYATVSGKKESYYVLDQCGMSYILTDENDQYIRQQGEDTRGKRHSTYLLTTSASNDDDKLTDGELLNRYTYEIIDDKKSYIVRPAGDGDDIELDDMELIKHMFQNFDKLYEDEEIQTDVSVTAGEGSSGEEKGFSSGFANGFKDGFEGKNNEELDRISKVATLKNDRSFMQMPIWVKIEIPDKGQIVYFRLMVTTRMKDLIGIFVMLILFAAIIGLIMLTFFIIFIRGLLRARKMRNLLFTDIKVDGHNWLWFVYYAENKLSRRVNAKKDFALIDLEFVGYRRFCACNSVDEGEAKLVEVYNTLKRYVNKKELFAHCSEDSFALLLDFTDVESFRQRIGVILGALSEIEKGSSLAFHAGIYPIKALEKGESFSMRKNEDIEKDFNNACAACASMAGSESSGYALYDDKLIEDQRWIETVSQKQQKALDNEEFLVYYQPKYDPRSHELRGAEALIRWQSPEHGFLSPYKFIPIFESNGFITEIDHYMISHVARDQKRWLDAGMKCVPVSVNVSRAHFIESDLAEQIRDIVDKEGAPHHLIEIELTESAFFDDKNAMVETISRLKSYGFAVSMDDFGSGYSSLNSLKDMPLDVLKLDAEFFRGEAADTERGEVVVSEAIKLAKSLNMRTVAEGVEIKEQVDFLAAQGCDMIQGYYFAKPMPAQDYEQRMITGRSDGGQ
ncbi:MAG: EAL domain-containing protein [Ruminococcus sp.]|nr:EAL domain-containing protein [Ruminococcus sp.]